MTLNDWCVGVDRGGVTIAFTEHGDATPAEEGTHGDLWSIPTDRDAFNQQRSGICSQAGADSWHCLYYLILEWNNDHLQFSGTRGKILEKSNVECALRPVQSLLIVSVFFWLVFRQIKCYRVAERRCFLGFKDTPESRRTSGCVMLLHISKKLWGLTGYRPSSEWFLLFNDISLDSVQAGFNVNCLLCLIRGRRNLFQQMPGERPARQTTSTTAQTVSEIQTPSTRFFSLPV